MRWQQNKRQAAIQKELDAVIRQEKKLENAALKKQPSEKKEEQIQKIPPKVYNGLEAAFQKGFSLLFQKGTNLIEKSYDKDDILADHKVRDYAVLVKGGRRELKQMSKGSKKSDSINLLISTAEGIGLGALGIGMPDIVLFLSVLLKGIYQTALSYGYGYESNEEKYLILKLMETSLSNGVQWQENHSEVENLLRFNLFVTDEELQEQIKRTASTFALDMLIFKMIQGLPIVGIIGGAVNPIYYKKVMRYVRLQYQKRYLLQQMGIGKIV